MAMDLSGLVRQRTEIVIGTKKFIFTEVSMGDLAEFRAETQKKKEEYNKQRRQRIIEDAKKLDGVNALELLKYVDKPLTDAEMEAEMDTVEGVGFLAYLSLRYVHPEVSRDDASKILSPSALDLVTSAMFPTNGEQKKTKKPIRREHP